MRASSPHSRSRFSKYAARTSGREGSSFTLTLRHLVSSLAVSSHLGDARPRRLQEQERPVALGADPQLDRTSQAGLVARPIPRQHPRAAILRCARYLTCRPFPGPPRVSFMRVAHVLQISSLSRIGSRTESPPRSRATGRRVGSGRPRGEEKRKGEEEERLGASSSRTVEFRISRSFPSPMPALASPGRDLIASLPPRAVASTRGPHYQIRLTKFYGSDIFYASPPILDFTVARGRSRWRRWGGIKLAPLLLYLTKYYAAGRRARIGPVREGSDRRAALKLRSRGGDGNVISSAANGAGISSRRTVKRRRSRLSRWRASARSIYEIVPISISLPLNVIARNSFVAPVRCNQLINCAHGDINFISEWSEGTPCITRSTLPSLCPF